MSAPSSTPSSTSSSTTAHAFPDAELAARMANAIRALSMDAVQQAKSGHPGMPMGMADIAVALWAGHLRHDPRHPTWFDRDRFVVSNGHGSMLLYSLLHLTGYDLPIKELKNFRQLKSKTPGHPENFVTCGVETTTGPLGQGLSNAVGLALAEKMMASEFNRPGLDIVDHFTWVFAGDGCLMEGISHEACSLAGVLDLSKLVVFYDDNGISIDGKVGPWFKDDTAKRFESYGWNVIANIDGHDTWAVHQAIEQAKEWGRKGRSIASTDAQTQRTRFAPTLIMCRTMIGKGSPNRAGTAKAHGEALGADEIALTRKALNWSHPPFEVPADLYAAWDASAQGEQLRAGWNDLFSRYQKQHPKEAADFERRMRGVLPADFEKTVKAAIDASRNGKAIATRAASKAALDVFGPAMSELVGGSADLAGSNLTEWTGVQALRVDESNGARVNTGRHINYGVREFGMAGVMNGLGLHGGFLPFGGTFLVFSDYMRNAVRMAALMQQRVIHVFTHDSIGLGEDGPTHQPIEHATSLRVIPNLAVWRPADQTETAVAWASALAREDGPSALLLSRQAMPYLDIPEAQLDDVRRGAHVVFEGGGQPGDRRTGPDALVIATGSEVGLALEAAKELAADGISVRVVSMPSTTTFDRQDVTFRRRMLPDNVPRVGVEAGVTDIWWKYRCDAAVGIDRFGESGPAADVYKYLGVTAQAVAQAVRSVIRKSS